MVRTVERNKEHNNLYPKQIITSEISPIHNKYSLFESLGGNNPQGRLVLEETHALLYGSLTLFIRRRHQHSLSRRAPREVPECKCSKYLEKLGSYVPCYCFCYHILFTGFPMHVNFKFYEGAMNKYTLQSRVAQMINFCGKIVSNLIWRYE